MFKGSFNEVGSFKEENQWCFKEVSRVFQGIFKSVSRRLKGNFKGV